MFKIFKNANDSPIMKITVTAVFTGLSIKEMHLCLHPREFREEVLVSP